MNLPVYDIEMQKPKLGNKTICLQQHGVYILEKGPCSWRVCINTRIGNGSMSAYDALPDESGRLPDGAKLLCNASPTILGAWAPDAGCDIGLTIVLHGSSSMSNLPPCMTIGWHKFEEQKRKIEDV